LEKNPNTGFYDLPIIQMEDGTIARGAPPNLEFWDAMKRSLNDKYISLSNRSNPLYSGEIASQVASANKSMTNALTNRFQPYKEALDFGKRYFGEQDAYDAGLNFFKQASGATRTDPVMWSQYLKSANTYSPQEIKNFQMGLLQFAKSDPAFVARAYADKKGAGALTRDNMSKVKNIIPPSLAQSIADASQMHNISALESTLRANVGPSAPGSNLGAWGVLGGIGSAAAEHFSPGVLAAIAKDPYAIASAVAAGTAYAAKKGYNAFADSMERRRADAVLELINTGDPQILAQIRRSMATNKTVRDGINAIELGLSNAVSSNTKAQETVERAAGYPTAPVARKAGGRVAKVSAEQRAEKLIRMADLAKKHVNKTTEQILSAPDETVARALKIAQAHI
jgi:hypothetical protein